MNVIYETKGKAREYCELAANLYKGCDHGCLYCYAPAATWADRDTFKQSTARDGVISKFTKDCAEMSFPWAKETRPILLSFTCDPYQLQDMTDQLTRQAIQIIRHYGLTVCVLTKGGKRAERDFDLLTKEDNFGVTLTFLDSKESRKWEPLAALPGERIESLQRAKALGIPTWVSLEPVINPSVSLEIIRQTHEFVDMFKVGRWNHDAEAEKIDWAKFAHDAVALLESLKARYYIKKDLAKYLS